MDRNIITFDNPLSCFRAWRAALLAVLVWIYPAGHALATGATASAFQFATLADHSLEELMAVPVLRVTSAARRPQKLQHTPAAIHVITRADIRQSGINNLPELLRMAPGMQVARINGSTWAISSRGFNAKNSDNLLVMLDGRVLQTQTFTGVYWDSQDVVLEDIERIEVVRGPGGTLWGANAVTGIINIITRPAAHTQGGLVRFGSGTHDRQTTVRHGGTLGERGHYRVHAQHLRQSGFETFRGIDANDGRNLGSAGLRADWALNDGYSATVQGGVHRGASRHTGTELSLSPPSSRPLDYRIDLQGHYLLGRWSRVLSATDTWSLQVTYDQYQRRYFNLGERRDSFDADFQRHLLWGERHAIVWGLGYRRTGDDMDTTEVVSFEPRRRHDNTLSAFIQDEIALRDNLHLIAGSKFERNDYTGFEVQPNLRLRWQINAQSMAWAAVSRAVHTPSRTDSDGQVNAALVRAGPAVFVTRVLGNPDVRAEQVESVEAGYRFVSGERVQMDVSLFHSRHRHLMTFERRAAFVENGYQVIPLQMGNKARATTRGLEWSGEWRPAERWRLRGSATWLDMRLRRASDSNDGAIGQEAGRSPQRQAQLHLFHAPTPAVDMSAALYYVSRLPSFDIPAYTRFDVRVAWRPQRNVELSITGQNLLERSHPEFFNAGGPRTTEVPRSVFGALTWRF